MKSTKQIVGFIIGTVLIMILLFATAYKASLNEERLARFRERDQRQKAAYELGREVNDRICIAWKANITIDEFQKEFGPLSDLEGTTDPKYANMTHSFFHKESQRTFYLRFENGHLIGSQSNHGSGDIDTGVVLESEEYIKSELVRTVSLSIALLSWYIIIVLSILKQNVRNHAPITLIITALLCGLCWFLAPNYTPTLKGVMSNDNLGFFVVMFAISIGFVFADSNFLKPEIPFAIKTEDV
jgi:hypothetical protein